MSSRPANPSSPVPPVGTVAAKDPVNILMVDDQSAKLLSYEVILAELGENLIKASSGTEALRHLLATPIAVVLVDVCMPDLDGFELARMIREHPRLRDIAIILVSAVFLTDVDRLKGYHSGAVDYVPVPIIPDVLRAKVRVFADLYRATEQLRRLNAELEARVAQRTADLEASAESLRVSEQRFQLAIANSPISVCSHDRELRYTWVYNPLLGFAVDEMLGKRDDELAPAASVAELMALKRQVLELGEGERRQVRVVVGGVRSLLDVIAEPIREGDGEVAGLRVASTDITPIHDAEEQFRFLAETIPSMVWTATPEGTITYSNQRLQDYAAVSPGGATARWPDLCVHLDDQDRWRARWEECRRRGQVFEIEVRKVRRDGTHRWFLARAVPRRDDSGVHVVAWFGVSTDINAQKAMHEQLREADRRKDEFLAVLAHELRNPLAPILNAVNILGAQQFKHPELVWCRDVIRRQTEHLSRLVDDLLDVSRITRGRVKLQRQPVELRSVIAHAIEANRPLIDARQHDLKVEMPAQPLFVEGDVLRLSQVVGNLLNNAAKYTNVGGSIALSVHDERAEDGTEVAVTCVRDNGLGIPAEMLPRVFDLFVQVDGALDRAQGGLGIGLSLVRSLIELHGGSVEARSDGPGCGSQFVVRLPLVRIPAAVAASPSLESAHPSRSHVVLVADDNVDAAEGLAMLLRATGHIVHTACDGVEAVAVAERVRPTIVVLDVGMPRLNGYDAARQIRSHPWGRGMLLIAQTGWSQDKDRQRSAAAGFDNHLVKPVDFATLHRLINARDARGVDVGPDA